MTSLHAQAQNTKQSLIGDWVLTCNDSCKATQLLISEDQQLRYGATISPTDKQGLLQLQLVFPLGIYLPPQISIMVNDTQKTTPVTTCLPTGCIAIALLNNDLQQEMLEASSFKVRFFSTDTRENELTYSLNGFERTVAAINK
jgi:invasion protein IalB